MSIENQIDSFGKKPVRSLFKWAVILCLLSGVFTVFYYVSMPAKKAIERQVMVNSHQYIEGMEQRARVLKANIAEIDAMLATNPENKEQLLAQKRALSAQLKATIKE